MGAKSRLFLLIPTLLFFFFKVSAQSSDLSEELIKNQHQEISDVLFEQQKQWNEGNIDKFMLGYWNSEDLRFIGKGGVTKGYNRTLRNYKASYPDRETMGQLEFEIIEINSLSQDMAILIGKFTLIRTEDRPTGYFSLIWKRIDGQWLIISDHTSS